MSSAASSHRFPLSPSSYSENDLKVRSDFVRTHPVPQSPVSPLLMSVATKSYVSSYGNNQHTDEMAQRPSPRTNAETYMSHNQKSNSREEGTLKRSSRDDEEQHRDKRQKVDIARPERMEVDSNIVPTNHNRLPSRGENDQSTKNIKPTQTSKGDFDEPFLLSKSAVSRSRPDPQQHLLATYGLLPLLKTVARNDPETGEKINKLRKSYEGQIKTFGLSGRNKPVKCDREEPEPGPLRTLAIVPEQEWETGEGKSRIEVTPDFRAQLEKAMQLRPGTVRNNAMWEDLLGHEKPKPTMMSNAGQSSQPPRMPNGLSRPVQSAAGSATQRSTRGNRRSYGDDSYVGYGEGYSEGDDDVR